MRYFLNIVVIETAVLNPPAPDTITFTPSVLNVTTTDYNIASIETSKRNALPCIS